LNVVLPGRSEEQERRRQMGFLDNVLGSSVPQGNLAKPLLIGLTALLASGVLTRRPAASAPAGDAAPGGTAPGGTAAATDGGLLSGLGGLLDRFQQNGQGNVVNSWIGSGQNQPISPAQLGSALGPDVISALAQRTGLPQEQITAELSRILPGVVDKLTPNGRLPTQAELAQMG
jgi:uncharacterized protein YidB (DUF937 family)